MEIKSASFRVNLRRKFRREPGLLAAFLLLLLLTWGCSPSSSPKGTVRIGCKNFSEQLILGEMMAQLLENEKIPVERKFGLGTTQLIHSALTQGDIDLYAEYTGTAMEAILHCDPKSDLAAIRKAYRDQFQVEWLSPFGFNDTYAIAVRQADADSKHWKRISDLKPAQNLRAGFNAEFMGRSDGWPGLKAAYGLRFSKIITLDATLIYQALNENQADVIGAFSTDGRLDAYHLVVLEDDLHFFPRYDPAPVVRLKTLGQFPTIRATLEKIPGHLNDTTMRRLNFEVDENKRSPHDVARDFLLKEKLLQ